MNMPSVRTAKTSDAEKLLEYLEKVSGESDFLTIGPGDIKLSIEEEKKIIKNMTRNKNSLFLLAVEDNKIVGVLTFSCGSKPRTKHSGDFGITVLKDSWGIGIGSLLIENFLNWAKKSKTIRKINLRVNVKNKRAISIYKKFGFRKEGKISRDALIKGKFVDAYLMGLKID